MGVLPAIVPAVMVFTWSLELGGALFPCPCLCNVPGVTVVRTQRWSGHSGCFG